jgi:hypothetical protein
MEANGVGEGETSRVNCFAAAMLSVADEPFFDKCGVADDRGTECFDYGLEAVGNVRATRKPTVSMRLLS